MKKRNWKILTLTALTVLCCLFCGMWQACAEGAGEYDNGGLHMEIAPKYNALVTVETPENDENGLLFTVSETASLEAGKHEGAGWLFSVGRISEARLRQLLCSDMSGVSVFARDGDGAYYAYYHPTDVRYERASLEEMQRDSAQWTMLCEWAAEMPDKIAEANGLETVSYGNSDLDICLARAAWEADVNATLSTTEYGPISLGGVDGTPYVEFVMQGLFRETDAEEAPDGEYVVLSFPEEEQRVDFFVAPGGYARMVSGERETLYQALQVDDERSFADAMRDWYYALAERDGIRPAQG